MSFIQCRCLLYNVVILICVSVRTDRSLWATLPPSSWALKSRIWCGSSDTTSPHRRRWVLFLYILLHHNQICWSSCSILPPPPLLATGPHKVPQVCQLGSAPGGQAGSGAAVEVEADGRGGLPGAAVLPVHQPDCTTLRCGTPAPGGWRGRRSLYLCRWMMMRMMSPETKFYSKVYF